MYNCQESDGWKPVSRIANCKMSRCPLLPIVKFLFICPTQRKICLTEWCLNAVLVVYVTSCNAIALVVNACEVFVNIDRWLSLACQPLLNYTNCNGLLGFSFCSVCGNDGILYFCVVYSYFLLASIPLLLELDIVCHLKSCLDGFFLLRTKRVSVHSLKSVQLLHYSPPPSFSGNL